MDHPTIVALDRDTAFASARLALARAHLRHVQVRQHRAINHLTMGPSLLLQAVLLPVLFCGLLVLAQPYVLVLWRDVVLFWAQQLDMPLGASSAGAAATKLGLSWQAGNPLLDLPSGWTMVMTALFTLAAFLTSFAMNGRMFPLKYLVRIVCVVQAMAVVFFWFQPVRFPYNIANHANDLASMGYVLLLAIPVMLALGYYVLNIGLGAKIAPISNRFELVSFKSFGF